jgi:hypothetical protein
MIIARTLSLALRFAQFVCAAIVLGITAHFLHIYNGDATINKYDIPFDRLIYSIIISSVSLVLALIWMVPTTASIIHWVVDLLFAAAWFAIFGILQDWYDNELLCGNGWHWRFFNGGCGQWSAAQAFAFLSAVLWLVSAILGVLIWSKRNQGAAPVEGEGAVAG